MTEVPKPTKSNVHVAVRVRPVSKKVSQVVTTTPDAVIVDEAQKDVPSKSFGFDTVFDQNVEQDTVYNSIGQKVLDVAFEGYNACLFAYGQTGSGKTHTLLGYEGYPGIIPRLCTELFERIGDRRNTSDSGVIYSAQVEVEYMEIYGDKVRDLLDPNGLIRNGKPGHKDLRVREHPRRGPYVEGLLRKEVHTDGDISVLMEKGNAERTVASTKLNDVSSRSHAVFIITLSQTSLSVDAKGKQRVTSSVTSTINLIDLAGSERVKDSGAEGKQLKEAAHINTSLSALGKVISCLAEGHGEVVPYRESKLTYLLKESLGGNSKTFMIATVSPEARFSSETLSTLRYASKCKNIVNIVSVNEDPVAQRIRDLQAMVVQLRNKLASAQGDHAHQEVLEQELDVNHKMMDNLHTVWVKSRGGDAHRHDLEQAQVAMRELESAGRAHSSKYKELREKVTKLQKSASANDQEVAETNAKLEELVTEQNKLAEKEKEVACVKQDMELHKEETEQKVKSTEKQLKNVTLRERSLQQQTEQRDSILIKVMRENEVELKALGREMEELKDRIAKAQKERDELVEWNRQVDVWSAQPTSTSPQSGGLSSAHGNLQSPPVAIGSSGNGQLTSRFVRNRSLPKGKPIRANDGDWEARRLKLESIIRELTRDTEVAKQQVLDRDKEIAALQHFLERQVMWENESKEELEGYKQILHNMQHPSNASSLDTGSPGPNTNRSSSSTTSNPSSRSSTSQGSAERTVRWHTPNQQQTGNTISHQLHNMRSSTPPRSTPSPHRASPLGSSQHNNNNSNTFNSTVPSNNARNSSPSGTAAMRSSSTPSVPPQGRSSSSSSRRSATANSVLSLPDTLDDPLQTMDSSASISITRIDTSRSDREKKKSGVLSNLFKLPTADERRMKKIDKQRRKLEQQRELVERLRAGNS